VSLRIASALCLALAACSPGSSNDSPQEQCERQAMDDPAVVEIYTRSNGTYTMPWTARDDLLAAKHQAVLRCMRQKGLAPPGGVQPVRPR
jgi:hypothetical protein